MTYPLQDTRLKLSVGEQARSALVINPVNESSTSARPMLIALHGATQRGSIMRKATGLDIMAAEHGWVVVYPDAIKGLWKDGRLQDEGVADVVFIEQLIDHCVNEYKVDRALVSVAGVSNGGFLAQKLLLSKPGLFCAAAVVIATLGHAMLSVVPSKNRMTPMLMIAGRDDPIVLFDGGLGENAPSGLDANASLSYLQAIDFWTTHFELTLDKQIVYKDNGSQSVDLSYYKHQEDVLLTTLVVNGGGHYWFGQQLDPVYEKTFGPMTGVIHTTDEVVTFLMKQVSE